MAILKKHATSHPEEVKKNSLNEKIKNIEKVFSDIGVVVEVSEKRDFNSFSDSKRIRISKEGKIF